MVRQIADVVACGFGLGLLPKAPGTWGSLLGMGLVLGLGKINPMVEAGVSLFLFLLGIVSIYFSSTGGKVDSSKIVIDEVWGMWISQFMLEKTFGWLAASFLVFRVLDIWKPTPVSFFDQRMKNSFGIMMDDGVAGLITNLLLHGVSKFLVP